MNQAISILVEQGDEADDARVQALVAETNSLLKLLIVIYDKKALADHFRDLGIDGFDRDYLGKWVKNPRSNPKALSAGMQEKVRSALLPERPAHFDNPDFTFIDLFAGIGGIRKGFEEVGGKCVFTSEWDDYARRTYLANNYVEDDELPYFLDSEEENPKRNRSHMDIQKITLSNDPKARDNEIVRNIRAHIPEHDVLLAGFPCQPFSLAGVSKKNSLGRAHGFDCETQGTLFFDVEKIIEARKPKYFVLENVKNLKGHDGGNTFAVIVRALHKLGYWVADITDDGDDIEEAIKAVRKRKPEPTIIDAAHFTPQHRERIVLIGVRNDLPHEGLTLKGIEKNQKQARPSLKQILSRDVDEKYTLTQNLWEYLFRYALKHQAKGNGFGFGLVDPTDRKAVTRTLSARYHKDGSEILINHAGMEPEYLEKAKLDPERHFRAAFKTPRRLTPLECARLMGFEKPEKAKGKQNPEFRIPVSDTRAYKQFGNSVVVPVFRAVAELLEPHIRESKKS